MPCAIDSSDTQCCKASGTFECGQLDGIVVVAVLGGFVLQVVKLREVGFIRGLLDNVRAPFVQARINRVGRYLLPLEAEVRVDRDVEPVELTRTVQ